MLRRTVSRRYELFPKSAAFYPVAELAEIDANQPPLSVKVPKSIYLKPSCNPDRLPSILFKRDPKHLPEYAIPFATGQLSTAQPLYSITSPTTEYYSLRLAFLRAGFRRILPNAPIECNAVIGRSLPVPAPGESIPHTKFLTPLHHQHQVFNHFPGGHRNLGCKAGLANNLMKAAALFPEEYSFIPRTLTWPRESEKIKQMLSEAPPTSQFIWKPARGSCGRGIVITRGGRANEAEWAGHIKRMEEVIALGSSAAEGDTTHDDPVRTFTPLFSQPAELFRTVVVQEYIPNPMLIFGRKFDLRLYVVVTSYDPLVAYLHSEGLVRFAAKPYKESEVYDRASHLTNYSIGRKLEQKGPNGEAAPSLDLKWSIGKLQATMQTREGLGSTPQYSNEESWAQVHHIINTTLLAVKSNIVQLSKLQSQVRAFELYGFDVMFDATGKAWLVEVNTLPSLESSSSFDYEVKSNVVTDALNMVQLELFDRPQSQFERSFLAVPDLYKSEVGVSVGATGIAPTKALVHLQSEVMPMTRMPSESPADVLCRLQDEQAYRGGFQRLFPPSSPAERDRYARMLPIMGGTELDVAAMQSSA